MYIDVYPDYHPGETTQAPGSVYEADQAYVTVDDVLKAIERMLGCKVNFGKTDTSDSEMDARVRRTSKRRHSMLKAHFSGDKNEYIAAKSRGCLLVDFLRQRYVFAGFTFAFGEDMTRWLILETKRDRKRAV